MTATRIAAASRRTMMLAVAAGVLAGCSSFSGGSQPAQPVYVVLPSGEKVPACSDGTAPPCTSR
ncbi:hypothetical protein [Lichenicoccus sp.]|uniref:hypothetical protein n=1 Tax=Lichenicoccus sp. TaxID=2781899 RepID=UPI003D0CA8E6